MKNVLLGRSKPGVNRTHQDWNALIEVHKMPFIRVELLRDNPKGVADIACIDQLLEKIGDYPTSNIHRHLARVGNSEGKGGITREGGNYNSGT